jgi:hypothetical protein
LEKSQRKRVKKMEFGKYISQIVEVSNAFFEGGPRFVHAPNCKNAQLSRETKIKDGKKTTARSCAECKKSDVIETNVVDRIF